MNAGHGASGPPAAHWTSAPSESDERRLGECDDAMRSTLRAMRFACSRIEEQLTDGDCFDPRILRRLLRLLAEARHNLDYACRNDLAPVLARLATEREGTLQ